MVTTSICGAEPQAERPSERSERHYALVMNEASLAQLSPFGMY